MIRYILVPILLAASSQAYYPSIPSRQHSAASPAQIRFAIENKYDNTGPGATEPAAAYKAYKNLDEALVAYVDDPDTQLPQHEKARAIANLYRHKESPRNLPFLSTNYATIDETKFGLPYNDRDMNELKESFRWSKEEPKKKIPPFPHAVIKPFRYQYIPNPDVEFSVDVHDKETGDLKTAQELRDGSGTVHGYYTVQNPDGRRKTVHYQKNDEHGFRTSVMRLY
ncbi:insect cuticle protein domain-containing protein [Phthorimaea operculella]|nr:insect cuticle protein domain-containing protein [Phthorimaea operculella]